MGRKNGFTKGLAKTMKSSSEFFQFLSEMSLKECLIGRNSWRIQQRHSPGFWRISGGSPEDLWKRFWRFQWKIAHDYRSWLEICSYKISYSLMCIVVFSCVNIFSKSNQNNKKKETNDSRGLLSEKEQIKRSNYYYWCVYESWLFLHTENWKTFSLLQYTIVRLCKLADTSKIFVIVLSKFPFLESVPVIQQSI